MFEQKRLKCNADCLRPFEWLGVVSNPQLRLSHSAPFRPLIQTPNCLGILRLMLFALILTSLLTNSLIPQLKHIFLDYKLLISESTHLDGVLHAYVSNSFDAYKAKFIVMKYIFQAKMLWNFKSNRSEIMILKKILNKFLIVKSYFCNLYNSNV